MIGLLDSDIITYRCGFAAEKKEKKELPDGDIEHIRHVEPAGHAIQAVETLLESLRSKFDKLEFYLSGKNNWRVKAATIRGYKENRSPFAKPFHYQTIRDYLVERYKAEVVDGMEADDAIGIRATSAADTCIVSTDKDLDMIPGKHYNWVKDNSYTIGEIDGIRNFYKQGLIGDRIDNIPGIHGIGPVKAAKILDRVDDERRMYSAVRYQWNHNYPHGYEQRRPDDVLHEVLSLLWIARHDRKRWSPPV